MSYQSRQFMQQITKLQRDRDRLIQPEISPDLISPFLALPMLRGFWAGHVDSNGDWYDTTDPGMTLTRNGDPQFGAVPLYWWYDGVGDYHNRADEANLRIIGTEAYVQPAYRGLTLGGWFFPTADGAFLMGKANDTNGPYFLYIAGGSLLFRIRNAADAANFDVTTPYVLNAWQFFVGRYDPSTEIKVWNGTTTNTNVAGIPASLWTDVDAFSIGALGASGAHFTGAAALCFLCAGLASDAVVSSVFQQTRGAFGV